MAATYRPAGRPRGLAIAAAMGVHLLLALLLWRGFVSHPARQAEETLAMFDVPPTTPVQPPPIPATAPLPRAAAAPANRAAEPKPIVAPLPIVLSTRPFAAPPVAATGPATDAGAAPQPGPGIGAGETGNGTGASGNGTGGGTSARLIKGRIAKGDYPHDARRERLQGTVTVGFTVQPDGRATGCRIVRSSGAPSLDATTCTLVEKRFRYAPARDAAGRPIAEERGWQQRWWLEGDAAPLAPPLD